MGGKGSGRHKKPLIVVIEEMKEQVRLLDDNVYALNLKVNGLTARLNYWLKKMKIEGYRRRMKG